MAIYGTPNEENENVDALGSQDNGATGSVYDEYFRKLQAEAVANQEAYAPALEKVGFDATPIVRQSTFETYDPDPTGAHTKVEGERNGSHWGSNYVKELVVAGKLMSADELNQTEAGRKLLAVATRARMGMKRDFVDAIMDVSAADLPFFGMFASVGRSFKDAYDVSKTIDRLNAGEDVDAESRAKLGLYMAENAEQSQGTWGSKIGDIVRAAPGFMMEFFASGALLGAGRNALARKLAEGGSAKALSTYGLTRTTKMLADETAADAMGVVIKEFAEASAEGATKAGLASAARTVMGNAKVRGDVVKSVADVLEKSILSSEAAAVTGADAWGSEMVRKVAEARAATAVEGYLKTHAASGFVEKSTRALGRVLADGFSRGALDVGAWGTEQSTALFTSGTSAGKALTDALTTFFVEAPLKGGELYLANKAVSTPISTVLGGTVGRQELAIKLAALQNNDQELMNRAHAIGVGLDLLEYISENTGRGLQELGRAGILKFAPKLAKPAARVAGEMHFTKATLKRNAANEVVGAELEGLIEKGHGAEVGGIIQRYVSRVLGNPDDVKTNVLSDQVTAVTRALQKEGVRVSNPSALAATIHEGAPVIGLSRDVAEKLGDDVGAYVKKALRAAYDEKADGMKLRSMVNYYMADYMARKQIGPQTAAAIFERMGYNGILGEMFEERYHDVMSGLFGLNADKDRSMANRLKNAWDGFFPGWDQLTAEAVGFAFPLVAKAGFQRALRAIGGGNAYTEFADTAALYLDGTRHGSVGQWRYGDVLTGHARAVRAERDKITAAQQRREKVLSERPELADAQWDADNIAPIDAEIATAEKAITRLDAHHQRFLSSLSNEQRTGYSHLVSYAPMSVETAELPDAEFNIKLAATEADAARSVSAAKVLTSRAGRMGQTLYKLESRTADEDERAFRKAAHWVVKVAGAITTGDMSLFSANPAQWVGVDRGLPEGVQTQLKKGYEKIFASELERDRNARIANAVYDRSSGPTYQADLDAAHARALERFNPIAERIMAASLAAHQARMFSDQELTDAAIAEVARGKGLMLDEEHREFVSISGERQSIADFHEANKAEVRKFRNKAASTLFDTLSSGSLQSGRIVFNRTRDDANPVVDVLDIPKNLPTEEQAVVSMILKRIPGMQNVLRAHEVAVDRPIDDQVSGPATRQEWLDAVVRTVVPGGQITAASMKTALDNAMTVDPVVLENIARDLNFQYDGTEADLVRRNREIVELAVLSKTLGDPNVRTYARDGAMVENDPAASEWTDYVSARRRADGLWTYMDAAGHSQIATSIEDLDAKMAEQGRWAPIDPKVVFTSAQIFQSSDAMTMMSALGLKRQYKAALERQCDDVDYKDPLFREGTDTYNDPVKADAKRAEEKALSDLYERNSHQTNPQLYLVPGEYADDAEAMQRAEKRMKRAQDAYFRRNDETRGYARIADDLLRRSGVSVPFAGGFSVGLVNADLRGKYSISVNAFRAKRQSGNVFVSIDHGIAQNYKSALLNAVMLDAYSRNRRLIADVFDSGIRGFMDDVNRVAFEVQNSSKDQMLAANIADFRAATVDHEKGVERKPSPMTFSLLVRAFALYQTEYDGNLKSVLGDYAPALKAIAPAVRNLPSFQVFMAVADRVFGGSGFNPSAIRTRGGADNTTGLARVYGLFAPNDSPSLRSEIEKSRPGGLSAEEFLARVSEQDVSAVKAGLKRTSSKPKARTDTNVDVAPPVVTDDMRAAQERLAARRAQQAAERQADNPVSDMQATQEAVAAGQIDAADENDLNALVASVAGESEPVEGVQPVSAETARAAAQARLAEVREQQNQVRADIGGGEATDMQQEELSALSDEETRIVSALEEPAEGISALESAAADEAFGALPTDEVDGDETEDEVEDNLFFVAGDATTTSEDTSSETTANGEQKSFVLKDKAELTQGEVKALVPVLAKMFHAVNNIDPTEDELRSFLRQLSPGMRDRDIDMFAKTYAAMDAKARQNEFDDLWTFDSDDDEEGALPDGVEDGGRKAVMALQTKALSNFLALAQLVNSHTGRQFQGFMEDLRSTVARSLAVSGDTPSGALQFVSGLVNPRARDAASPAIRDAYFAETLAKFVTHENDVAGYIRDLIGMSKSRPVNRKAAILVAYLAAMPPNVRRQMTQLVSSSAPSVPVMISESFHDADGNERQGKRAGTVTFSVSRRRGNASRLSSDAVAATFREFVGKTPDQIRVAADAILADAREMANAGKFTGVYASRFAARGNAPSLFNSMAELFERHFGADSTIVSVFSSHPAGAYIAERPEAKDVRAAMTATPGKVPFMVDTVVGGLQLMADIAGKSPATSENADLAAALSFTMGDPRKAGLGWKTNTSRRTDQIATVFRAYEEMMPQTIMTASVDPDRTNQPASSVAITMRGVEPAVQVFMDRLGDKGFRAVCDKYFPQFAKADEATKRRVLGICRQSMCWPTAKRDGIVAKSLSKSAFSRETYLACETSFNLKKGILKGTPVEELQKLYGTKAVLKAMTEVSATVDPATKQTKYVDRENTFYVPVYSGDHSSAILISVPLLSSFNGTYEEAAKEVSSWVGLDLLGVDAKRSATTSLEAPGVGFIGLKHNPDGSVKMKKATTRDRKRGDAVNVWYGSGENADLSNLASRPFVHGGRRYLSVEHAYQTLKSGTFDANTYGKYTKAGVKIVGSRKADMKTNVALMNELVLESFQQNPGAAKALLDTGDATITHTQDPGIWKTEFPKALMAARDALATESEAPETGECRINIVWSEKGGNESMLGTTLATGYGVEQLKLCAKDPRSSTLKFHAMNTANTGSYGPALSLIKSLDVAMGQTSDVGEFGKWSANRPLMDFIRKQRSTDFADSTSILTDFDSIKLALANSKMMGVKDKDGKPVALMEWFFDKFSERVKNEATLGALKDSYSGEELDKLFATEDNPEGLIDWIDLTDETTGEKRSGKRKLSSILDGVRLDFVDGLDGKAYSLSYVDNDMMGFQVANVSHRAETKEKGKTHYGKSPRNYMVDAFTMAQVQTVWNAVVAARPRPTQRTGETDADFAKRVSEWENTYDAMSSGIVENANAVQELIARWGEIATAMATDPRTVEALRHDSEDAVNAVARGEPADGQFMRDIMARAMSTYLKKHLNLPMKGIDAPLVSNMSWIENGEAKTHSKSQMFKDTLRGSRTIPMKDRSFMRAARRMALCNLNNCDASFRYGMYLDEDAFEREFGSDELLQTLNTDGLTPAQKTIARLDAIFTRLRDLEEKLSGAVTMTDKSAVTQTVELRRKIAACFLDHHGRTMDTHIRHYTVKGEARTAQWYLEVSYDDLFTNLVKDANGRPTFDRSAVYEDMTDSKGVKRMYLGGTMVGLPRTPSYNGSMWLQTVRAALPVTEIEHEDGDWSSGRDAMVAPDPFTLKILGCDHDGDKTKLYMLEVPSVSTDAKSADARAVRDAKRFLDLTAGVESLVRTRKERGAKKANGKFDETSHELELTPVAQMQVNNSFVQALFDMSRALPVMDNSDGSSSFYTGERVSETKNHGAVARGTKAALTAVLKELAGEDGAEQFAWDTAITKNPDIIGPKLLDPAKGKTVGRPLTAAEVGDGAQNAASARALVVSLASSLHLSWASGVFRDGLFRGIGTGAEEARNWLDFMYHLDGFSNMTFDDIKEQVCSRLGVTAGMMDTIICDMVNYGRRIGHLPRTDEEFIEAFKGYAKDVKNGGMRFFMKRATDKGDYAMQAEVRTAFAGSAEAEVTQESLAQFFGGAYDWKQKQFVVTNSEARGAKLITALRTTGAEEYAKTYRVSLDYAKQVVESVVGAITKMRTKFSDTSGAVLYAVDHLDGKTLADLIAWHEAKSDLRKAKQFARSVNYLTADPVANNAEDEAETRTDGFDSVTKDVEFTKQIERLSRMNASVKAIYAAVAGETVHGYGFAAANSYEDDVTVFCANGGNDRLALKLLAAQRVDANDTMAVEAASEMTGLSLAALRSTRVLPGSKINSGNILRVLARISNGSYETVRGGKGVRNRVLDMKRGIEDMFELMYRLVQSSTARSSLPIFTYFSERSEGSFGYDYETYYNDAAATDRMNRITLAFQGVTESQIADVRKLYNRVVSGELDKATRIGAYDKEATDFNFTLSMENLDALLASKDMMSKIDRQSSSTEKEALIGLVKETKAILGQLEKELGSGVKITPSIMFGQILPAYAALTTRLDRVPDSRSSSIVTAMGDTYSRWATELANLRRNHPSLMRMATAINFAPSMAMFESNEGDTKPGVRWMNAQLQEMLDRDAAKLLEKANSEVDEKHTVFQTRSGKLLRKRLVDGEYALGNPAGRYIVDPFGNSTVYWDIYEALGPKAEPAPVEEPDPVVETISETIKAEDMNPVLPEENPYVKELAERMGSLVRNWTNARIEYRGGNEFFIHADLRGSKATAKNHNGRTVIRVVVKDGELYSDGELKNILEKNLSGAESSWLVSNANRRSDVTGKKITAEQVKAELLAMTPEKQMEYIKAWRPVGATHNNSTFFSSGWAVNAKAAGVLCREIELEQQTKYPNVVFHEYFHAVVGMFKELGVFNAEDIRHLQKRYGKHPVRSGWFNEEKAAEDFRRFVETGYVKNEDTRNIFQKLFDFCKALFEALTRTGVRSADYENEMSGSPLAAMVLTGTAEASHTGETGHPLVPVGTSELNGVPETDDPERFNPPDQSVEVIGSPATILSNEELRVWNAAGVGPNPRILTASEHTDPAFHVDEILKIINGEKEVMTWNGKGSGLTGKDFAGLYLITKHDGLPMKRLLETKIPKLIHFSITTLGSSVYEPGVMKYNDLLDRIGDYLKMGLDPDAVTIRIDPILPGVTKKSDIETVVRRSSEMGIKRVRFSVCDMYKNTLGHLSALGYDPVKHGYTYDGKTSTFHASQQTLDKIAEFMLTLGKKYGVTLGTCAEPLAKPGISREGCLSPEAVSKMLGVDVAASKSLQRKLCGCFGGKVDALAWSKDCASHCVYCYAKHDNDKALEYYNSDGTLKKNAFTDSGYREPVQPADFADLAALGAAIEEEEDYVIDDTPFEEPPKPEELMAASYLKTRFDRACANYVAALRKEAADYVREAPSMTEDNYWAPTIYTNVFGVSQDEDYPIIEVGDPTLGDFLAAEASAFAKSIGIEWRTGDSIAVFPKEVLEKNESLAYVGVTTLSREAMVLRSDYATNDDVSTQYELARFLSDCEGLMAQAKREKSRMLESGMSEDQADSASRDWIAKAGKNLAAEYDRALGRGLGTLFHTSYRKFLTKYGNLHQDADTEESMFDCAAPTVEEQVDGQLDAVVDPDRMRVVYSPADTLARAVGMAIRNSMSRTGLDEEAREVLSTVSSSKARELRGLERAAAVDAVRQVAVQRGIDPVSLKGKELENLTFAAIVELNSAIRGGGRAQGPTRFRNRTVNGVPVPSGSVETKDPFRLTSSALAGSIMAACGTTPADIGIAVKRDIAKMRGRYAGTTFERVLDKFDRAMDVLVSVDPSRLCEDPSFREDTLGDLLHSLEAGLVGGNILSDGSRDNYRLADVGTSFNPSFDANRALYGNHVDRNGEGNPDFQYISHRTIDSLYTVLAGMKFYRSLGFEPGSVEDAFADAPAPNTPDQTAAYLGIEARQLLERGAEALDYYDQPMFVANNMESWLESTVRNTFGHVDVGEYMRGMNNRHSGYMRRLTNEENWNASLMGLDVLPGQALAAVEEVTGGFSMENGEIIRKEGKTSYRFVRYNTNSPVHGRKSAKDETGSVISFTEDEARICDLVLKADKVFATGGRRIVTGVDRIRFTADDKLHTDTSYYSRANVEKRFESDGEFSDFDLALYRLDRQMPSFIADDLRTRFIETALSALRGANGTATEITDHVLRKLDVAGILVAHEELDRLTGRKILTCGALTLDIDDVERIFTSSSAREKLVKAGRKESWLTREARVKPLMSLYREVASYVRENPWLTDGDGAFFNNFNTTLPFVQGSGVFMYNANRTSRSVPARDPGEKMSVAEERFVAIMTTLETSTTVKRAVDASDDQLRLLGSVFGLKDMGPNAIRNAISNGDLAPGGRWGKATGIALSTNATIADVAEEIYRRLVESTWRKNGDPVIARVGGSTVVQRLIQTYERHKDSQQALAGGVGATDEMMYRTRGVLPANAQLGHAIHNAMEGITNALAFRGTLVNMLMAPDAEGHPTVYADPNLLMADAGGVPDAVWSTIARWWAEVNHLKYDETKSGMQNAHDIYKKLHDEFALKKTINGKGFGELSGEDIDAKSITGVMAQSDDRDEALNKLGGGYAMGYVKHLLQASRNFGSHAQRAIIHRALSYSKSLSVSFSMFFPLATQWESPIGAVGAVATLGSNLDPEWMRKHAGLVNASQKVFSGDGWITQNFIGYRDIVKMMDSNDPFLSEMIGWASSLGISLSDSRVNPLEPQRAILQRDVRNLVEMTRDKFGAKAAARLDGVLRTCLLNSGEKAFTYALNATKLATVAQIYMKLRHQAEKRGKAFDPVRDLKRYAGYINAEIGGIDPLKYAWAHPMNRGLMSMLLFSWEWTRGAWEAGGGGVIEDMVLGGHSMTAEERKYIVGRWVRMFSAVMIGIPVLFQFAIKAFAMALGHDDDDEKWWTWQNEDKTKWTAFDLTPLLRAMTETFPTVAQWKKDHPVLGSVLPMYTGSDKGNRTHGSFFNGRHYYMHFGKQGWEFFRWFSDAPGQFFSKLSMPTQRILEGVFGRSLSWMDRELPWGKMGPAERWLAPTLDGATANLVKAFLPFTYTGLSDKGDAGLLSVFGPIQMGASDGTIKTQMQKVLKAYAFNDRAGMALGNAPHGTKSGKFRVNVLNRNRELWHLAKIAQLNGASVKESLQLIDSALASMTASLYGDLLDALPEKVDGDFDAKRISRIARALNRLQRDHKTVMDTVEAKFEKRRMKLDPRLRRQWNEILKQAMEKPYDEPKRMDY